MSEERTNEKGYNKESGLYYAHYFNHVGQFFYCVRRVWGWTQ